jgi:pyruvate dehydrogenase E2 component (dihydrolipoamide acetyltransferase)
VPASHADNLPDRARVEIIDGKGHSVQMEAAGPVNRLVADFLRSAES